MEKFNELIKTCEQFINNEFGIDDFQHRIEMIIFS